MFSTTTSPAMVSSCIKKPLVFLGTPQVSVVVLDALFAASAVPNSCFEVVAIVTQPPSASGRGRKVSHSPIAQHSLKKGFPLDNIFTPEKTGEEAFLSRIRSLDPELCITAAYGNMLPDKFLSLPKLGTVNIHPSLLPLYRGAAPVQRALKDGVTETGVSLAFTVSAVDAGPVISRVKFNVDGQIKAPELLSLLFNEGSKLLVDELPSILDGTALQKAESQDETMATFAPKVTSEESWLCFSEEASVLHNKVRAFAGWPGTWASINILNGRRQQWDVLKLKVITTRVVDHCHSLEDTVTFGSAGLLFPCAARTTLEVLEVQIPGKAVVSASTFWNGFHGKQLKIVKELEDGDGVHHV